MNLKIEKIGDVTGFANWIMKVKQVNFHPDTPFEDYITPTGVPSFSPDESKQLNHLLAQCFEICEKNDADIYEITGKVLYECLGVVWS